MKLPRAALRLTLLTKLRRRSRPPLRNEISRRLRSVFMIWVEANRGQLDGSRSAHCFRCSHRLVCDKDSANFGLVQGMTALLVIALVVIVLAFWPARWAHLLDRRNKIT